jgi:hypothetical protein
LRHRIEGHRWCGGKNLQSKAYCEPIPLSVDLHSEVGEFPPVHRIKVAVASSIDVELRVGLLTTGLLLGAIAPKANGAELPDTARTGNVPKRTVSRPMLSHNISMRMVELTPSELCSVRCPTCGVAAGKRCHLHSGSTCIEPHLDRKLCAIEALEQKRILEGNLRAASKYHRAKLH